LGVTATPDRLDGKCIKELLFRCSYEKTLEDLINEDYLADLEGYLVKTKIDLSDIDHHNGDFSIRQLYKKLNTENRNKLILDVYQKEMSKRKTLIFCINIDHSKTIAKLLNSNEISCAHIDGTMNENERNAILSSFRNGEISCLTNCQLLTEGFDEPSIDGIIVARPTYSRALFTQMIGRGLRKSPGKMNCKVIDIVDNNSKAKSFNSLVHDMDYVNIDKFSGIKKIRQHIQDEQLKVTETIIERTNLLNSKPIFDHNSTDSILRYLNENNIYYQEPLSFVEGSFLVWFNELKMENANGNY